MKNFFKKTKIYFFGAIIGAINALLGAGGGMLTVPILRHLGLDEKESHSNAVAVILPITIVSAIMYLYKDYVNLSDSFIYIPTGLLGAVIGSFLLYKIPKKALRIAFSLFMVYAGIRLVIK